MGKVMVYKFFIFDPMQKRTTLSNVFITKSAGGCLDLLDTSAREIDDSELNSDCIYVPSSDCYFLPEEHEASTTQKIDETDNHGLLSTE
ncbi:hypothetical protein [uncultured Tolumonas sp.]|uniref:hypothetical protein n=1 Tax=uncultured Tolumonas sp. TaxID=263765 RepID=UPI00292DE3EB|nr:hypothetical protein [uncultured Tolumonas sp.]